MAAYYPRKVPSIKSLLKRMRASDPTADIDTWDDDEEDRLDHLSFAKQRGKGAPKKKKSADGEFLYIIGRPKNGGPKA